MKHRAILLVGSIAMALTAGCVTSHGGADGTAGRDAGGAFIDQLRQTAVDKVDLLFMIDNSASMAEKQRILVAAVPALVNRFVNPDCINPATLVRAPGGSPCPTGMIREFNAINDIHIGVVTSSLGGHGGDICSQASTLWTATQDDHAHLLPTVRSGLQSYNNLGFLAWKPGDAAAIGDAATLVSALQSYLAPAAVGETGCGFESQLESWYRFLVDPDPPIGITISGNTASVQSPDEVTLDQRRSFLRADSLLAIIMLTDENDCSIVDGGLGWIAATSTLGSSPFRMPSATSTCATDPNSPCCRSCGTVESSTPTGCTPVPQDPACVASKVLSPADDPLNLRCWDQKRRFGIDLLYPTSRYVTGLSSPIVTNRAGQTAPNPIYTDLSGTGVVPRDSSLVFLVGIVGVPWQDIADDASLTSPGLRYLTADELAATNRWSVIVGDPSKSPPLPPTDALMVESNRPRSGSPYYPPGGTLGAPNSTNPQENAINGHEYTPSLIAGDLEYACIFPLATPVTCAAGDAACDCMPDSNGGTTAIVAANKPLCQPPGGGVGSTTQYWAKAYPGLRELRVLRDFGANSIVASICPKVTDAADTAYYGYDPAVNAVIDRFKGALGARCFPRALNVNCDGSLACKVIEARPSGCNCNAAGYDPAPIDAATKRNVELELQSAGACGGIGQPSCEAWCECGVRQLQHDTECTQDLAPTSNSAGYCYIDAEQGIGNPELVSRCPDVQKRLLRFVGENLPAPGAIMFITCGDAFTTECDAKP